MAAARHEELVVESTTNAQAQKPTEDPVSTQHLEANVAPEAPKLTTQSILAVIVSFHGPTSNLAQLISFAVPVSSLQWLSIHPSHAISHSLGHSQRS